MNDLAILSRRATDVPPDAPWYIKMLVDGVQECWRWLSTWLVVIAASIPMLYEHLPDIQAAVSPKVFHYIETAFVILIFLGRIKRQTLPPSKE